jgi:hypothetical protein
MNQREFVSILDTRVAVSASQGVMDQLASPSGRSPSRNLVRLSKWFNALQESDKAAVKQVTRMVSYAATSDFLCILDGVAAVTEGGVGQFELSFVTPEGRTELEPGEDDLHDLFSEIIPQDIP